MFHVKRSEWSSEMSTEKMFVYDFCDACADGTTVKIIFFDVDTDKRISSVTMSDAKAGHKLLSAVCGYGYVEYFYCSADVIVVKARVHACDL